jgi:hypothetical protein
MHLLSTQKLVTKFGTKSITEQEKLRYYIFTLMIMAVASEINLWIPSETPYNGYDMTSFLILVLSTVIGNLIVFKANRDGSDYIARAICLTIPIGFKLIAAMAFICIPLFITYYHLGWISDEGFSIQEQFAFISLGLLFDFTYYFLLLKAIKQVNEIIEANS